MGILQQTSFQANTVDIKLKKLDKNAVTPSYTKEGDAAVDLYATSKQPNEEYGFIEYGTGLSLEIPKGYVGLIFPRSSISKTGLVLSNSVGVIDSGYRGEIKVRFWLNTEAASYVMNGEKPSLGYYNIGDRIAQLMVLPYPKINFIKEESLSESDRSDGGFGSTGK